ncbi:planctomycete extracellular domain protein [Burkholderia pseudomallei MSHR684]|nr:planctomycete extracellular domain protein [Burkholderia pseudomallei MSHR684]
MICVTVSVSCEFTLWRSCEYCWPAATSWLASVCALLIAVWRADGSAALFATVCRPVK